MKKVIEESLRLLQNQEPHVLATVVGTKGMTPQKAGAKELFRQDGTMVGTLGGGCVEGDIWFYAREILQEKGGPQLREYKLTADIAEQDGLVCGGAMRLFLDPIYGNETDETILSAAAQAYADDATVCIATVVKGETLPIGSKFLIHQSNEIWPAIPDAELAAAIRKTATKVAPTGSNELLRSTDGSEIFVEGYAMPPTVIILGGGHVGKAIYNTALLLGFRVVIIDDRPDFANPERFPNATETIVCDFASAFEKLEVPYNSFIIVATRGHKFDDRATLAAVETGARYIGLLGSKRKNLLIFNELQKQGVPLERIQAIHAPIGLNIGAITPEEIAISIVAEIVACLRGGDGQPMKSVADLARYLDFEPHNRIKEKPLTES